MVEARELTEGEKKLRIYLVVLSGLLFSVILITLFYLRTTPAQTATLTLSYAAGVSMIFLPCTFPLVFVIVPLSMGKGAHKGLIMSLLFSLGLTITITLYSVSVALIGQALGLEKATMIMYIAAGLAAFIFGLTELKLIRFKIPGGWGGGIPGFIQNQQDYVKAFGLGLFLGNAGVGCPNPATYVLLGYVASTGDAAYGAALGVVNGIGRSVPLIFLSILAILGVNAAQQLLKKKETIDKAVGWGLVWIGAIIITLGFFGHYWLLKTGTHTVWNKVFATAVGGRTAEYSCCIEPPCKQCLTDNMFGPNTCLCQYYYLKGETGRICGECVLGISQGKGVMVMAERTYKPALATLFSLSLAPIPWYLIKRRREGLITGKDPKNKNEEVR